MSSKKISDFLKAQRVSLSVNTIMNYLKYHSSVRVEHLKQWGFIEVRLIWIVVNAIPTGDLLGNSVSTISSSSYSIKFEIAYKGTTSILSYLEKFSSETLIPLAAFFSLRKRCKLCIFPLLPDFISIGTT